jgi:regulatory protein
MPLVLQHIAPHADGSIVLQFDSGEELRVLAETVIEMGLTSPRTLEPGETERLQQAHQFREVYQKALDLLGRREHSAWELKQKLRQRFPAFESLEQVLERLQQKHFLSDERFTIAFVRSRVQAKLWGPYRVRAELQQRGVPHDVIDLVLAQETDADLWRQNAVAFVQRESQRSGSTPQKLMRQLHQRGFAQDLIRQVVRAHSESY